jgi:hypothetical protein
MTCGIVAGRRRIKQARRFETAAKSRGLSRIAGGMGRNNQAPPLPVPLLHFAEEREPAFALSRAAYSVATDSMTRELLPVTGQIRRRVA